MSKILAKHLSEKLIKEKSKKVVFQYLIKEKNERSKIQLLDYSQLKLQKYLETAEMNT